MQIYSEYIFLSVGFLLGSLCLLVVLKIKYGSQVRELTNANAREIELMEARCSQAEKNELECRELSLKLKALETELNIHQEQQNRALLVAEQRLKQKEHESAELQQALTREHGKVNELSVRLENAETQMEEKLQLLNQAREQMKQEFQNVANRLFEDKSERFTEKNKDNIGNLLNPLREQLVDFRKRIDDVYDKESKDRVSLYREILSLKDLNSKMSEETTNLTRALKGDNKMQGNWGEMILERILEESGLQKGREYFTQESLNSEQGQRFRPDVIVHLPDNKDIVIDSKVSLRDWERYCAADDDVSGKQALTQMITSIRGHIRGLSQKNYADLPGIKTLDFVLLFVPVEGAFLKMLELEPGLYSEAFERNIMLVSPSTLLVTLRTVHNIWRYEYQNQNAEEIANRAGSMHDQFVLFAEALLDVGDKLEKAQSAYGIAYKRLISGRGNLVGRTIQLESMGAKAKKSLPRKIVEDSELAKSAESNTAILTESDATEATDSSHQAPSPEMELED